MRTCFYDEFRETIDQDLKRYTDPTKRSELIAWMLREAPDDPVVQQFARDVELLREKGMDLAQLAIDPPSDLLLAHRQLRLVQPRILNQHVGELALDLVRKAGLIEAPFVPFPALPFWIEFDNATVGDELNRIRALFVTTDALTFRIFLITAESTYTSMVLQQDGFWIFEPMGPCRQETCPFPLRKQEQYQIVSSEAKALMQQRCECASAGWNWSQLLRLVNHLLRSRQQVLIQHEVDRTQSLPHMNPRSAKTKKENREVEQANRRYPRYIEISLSQPIEIEVRSGQRRSPSSPSSLSSAEAYMDIVPVGAYTKVLIPGEGKPWKDLHFLLIGPHARSGHPAADRTRFLIGE